jgi:hypothetical protein
MTGVGLVTVLIMALDCLHLSVLDFVAVHWSGSTTAERRPFLGFLLNGWLHVRLQHSVWRSLVTSVSPKVTSRDETFFVAKLVLFL